MSQDHKRHSVSYPTTRVKTNFLIIQLYYQGGVLAVGVVAIERGGQRQVKGVS